VIDVARGSGAAGTGFGAAIERRGNRRERLRHVLTVVLVAVSVVGCDAAGVPTAPSTVTNAPGGSATPEFPGAQPTTPPPGLIGQVASGGYVLFFRHSARDASMISTGDLAVADNAGQCVPGSELTSEGASDAGRIGEAFRRYGIRVDRVYASPTCRTTQMARLMFNAPADTRRELTWPGMWTAEERTTLTPGLRALLGTVPAAGTNLVLLSHNDVLTESRVGVTVTLGQGDAAVFRPSGDGAFELVGKILLQEWLQ
jgi:phosphohistidine phosphatase SixA